MSEAFAETAVNLLKAIIVLFIIVDPFGNVPIFMSLTEKMIEAEKRKVFNTATLVGIILLLVFAFTGQEIFLIFGISIYSFEVAGGVLLLIIAIRILISGSPHENGGSPESMGAVPIAMPLLVGPGAITTTILNLQAYGTLVTIISVLVVLFITWIILRYLSVVYNFLGKTGAVVIARVMALLIAAMAIQYILGGISAFLANSP
ncbi:MAG: MarC family protein [Candidatus Bathyarchaeota archaeon]|nr:MarC family protein [Candidatus Bathyarchaeota archaeon]